MANFRGRYDPARLFLKRIGTLLLLIVVIAAGVGVVRVYLKERESQTLREYAEIEKHELEEQAGRLRTDTSKLKTDRGQEEALREQYDVGMRGEGLIVIVEPPTPEPIPAPPTFLEQVRKFFFFW